MHRPIKALHFSTPKRIQECLTYLKKFLAAGS